MNLKSKPFLNFHKIFQGKAILTEKGKPSFPLSRLKATATDMQPRNTKRPMHVEAINNS
jgi:hypothetical protein